MVSGMAKLAVPRHVAYELHRPFHGHGRISSAPVLSGFHHHYYRILIFGTDRYSG